MPTGFPAVRRGFDGSESSARAVRIAVATSPGRTARAGTPSQLLGWGRFGQSTSTAGSADGGLRCGELGEPGACRGGIPKPDGLLVLGGELALGLLAEVDQVAVDLLRLRKPLLEPRALGLEAGDLGFAWVGSLAGMLECVQAEFELGA